MEPLILNDLLDCSTGVETLQVSGLQFRCTEAVQAVLVNNSHCCTDSREPSTSGLKVVVPGAARTSRKRCRLVFVSQFKDLAGVEVATFLVSNAFLQ